LNTKSRPNPSAAVIYGLHPVLETLRAGKREIYEIYVSRASYGDPDLKARLDAGSIPIRTVNDPAMLSISGSPHHQGVAARVGPFPYLDLEDVLAAEKDPPGVIVILDEIQDPANLGSILRSSECLGAAGVLLAKDRSASVTPAAEKASAGASAHIPVARVVNVARTIERLKTEGYWIYAADRRAGRSFRSVDLTGKVALVFGSEGKGIRRLVRAGCDDGISIPMSGKIDSLNVAQTVAIMLSEALRQRPARELVHAESGER
jgi:23S rRNA (guanosine2251-2'-O)-methyltransferase